ncbi:hypothetical protein MWU60_17070 [Yoonia sp. F2084L]|uniref:hypothetical protein n=1 Tax=Yoonia sp. F2084L TaxID=2926419 RepID=UPI001FF46D1A|nr:hypothetical protein [Yoonia sp. F2084L]MCK0097292.1 hypothetical protein [Yoonia sp. F2084L]
MTDTFNPAQKAPLGVGAIISSSFSIMFGNFGKVFLLGFIGAFVGFIVNFAFLGFGMATGVGDPVVDPNTILIGSIFSMVINLAIYGLVTALLIQLAYDAKLGRSNSFGTYFKTALPAIFPIIVLTIVITILSGIGAIALLIGALWVYAVFYVMAPVAVIERGGFGSLGRSAALTKEYRWPIVGLFIVVMLLSGVLQFIATFAIGALGVAAGGTGGQLIAGIGLAMISGLAYAFGGIAIALVYARLREIKEGVDVDQIASVFE